MEPRALAARPFPKDSRSDRFRPREAHKHQKPGATGSKMVRKSLNEEPDESSGTSMFVFRASGL